MRVTYSGYYGAMNSGDDAFIEVSTWGASKFWSADEHLVFASKLPEIEAEALNYSPHSSYFKFAHAITDIFLSDFFVSAGGSTFHSALKATDLRTYAKIKKILSLKGKTGAIGISLGPYRDSKAEKNTVKYLETLDFLALRDNRSYEIACSYNLHCPVVNAFDLAALLPNVYGYHTDDTLGFLQKTRRTRKLIGVSLCNFESYTGGDNQKELKRNNFLISLLRELQKNENIKFRFFVFNGNPKIGDVELTKQAIISLNLASDKFELVPYLANVKLTFDKVSECDALISTRLHASVFACYAKVPFFLVEYHQKCTDFLDGVGQYEKYRLYDGDVEVSKSANEIVSVLNGSHRQPIFLEETIKKALLNFTSFI